jgi:hypothetical protein
MTNLRMERRSEAYASGATLMGLCFLEGLAVPDRNGGVLAVEKHAKPHPYRDPPFLPNEALAEDPAQRI